MRMDTFRGMGDWSDDAWGDAPDLSTPNIDTTSIDSFIDSVQGGGSDTGLPFDTAGVDSFIDGVQTPPALPDDTNVVDTSIYTGGLPTDAADPLPDQHITPGNDFPTSTPSSLPNVSTADIASFLRALTGSGLISGAAQGTANARPISSAAQFPVGASNSQAVRLPNGVVIPAGSVRQADGSIRLPSGQVYAASTINAVPSSSSSMMPMLLVGAGVLLLALS